MPHTYNLLSVTGSIISLISADTLYESFENDEKFHTSNTYTMCFEEYQAENPDSLLTQMQWEEDEEELYKGFLACYKRDLKTIEGYCEDGETFDSNNPTWRADLNTSLGVKIADIEVKGGVYARSCLTPEQILRL